MNVNSDKVHPCPCCGLGYVLIVPATRPDHGSAYDLGCKVCKIPTSLPTPQPYARLPEVAPLEPRLAPPPRIAIRPVKLTLIPGGKDETKNKA